MAPEQIEGRTEIDARTDVYAVGVLAFEMLTTRLPVGRFGPPSSEGATGAQLDAVVMRCLERDPERRFASMNELKTAIEQAIAGGPALVRIPRKKRGLTNEPRAIAMFATAMLLVPVLGISFIAVVADDGDHEHPHVSRHNDERSDVPECLTVRGEKVCGYNCKAGYGKAMCAEDPAMNCVADYGQLKCGYGCASAYGRIECAPEPGMECMAGNGATIACGYDCRPRDGGVVCKTENPDAPSVLAPSAPPEPPTPPAVPAVPAVPTFQSVTEAAHPCGETHERLVLCALENQHLSDRLIARFKDLEQYPDRIGTEERVCEVINSVLDEADCPTPPQ